MSLQIFRSLLFLLALFELNQVRASPVLLWSNSHFPRTAVQLHAMPPVELISNTICALQADKIQLRLFAVNGLKLEDIQYGSQRNHPVLVEAKEETSNFRFFPSVEDKDIYKTFSLIPQSNNMQCAHIHFTLSSHHVYDTLHDALNAMQSATQSVGTNSKHVVVMALTTGPVTAVDSSDRRRRATVEDAESIIVSDDNSCMFYADILYWTRQTDQNLVTYNYTLDLDGSSCKTNQTTGNQTTGSVILNLIWLNATATATDSLTVTLIVQLIGRYWYLQSVQLDNVDYRYFAYGAHDTMGTPPTYSYVCNNAVFVKFNSTSKIPAYDFTEKFYMTNFQFQPYNGINGTQFGPPNYCTSFFTVGIWMGITSSLLCLAILLFGISRMLSIQSIDRFDDPKGKPLLIKAQE